jgi:hypothetical protein
MLVPLARLMGLLPFNPSCATVKQQFDVIARLHRAIQ